MTNEWEAVGSVIRRKRYRIIPILPPEPRYDPPLWKTAPDHSWIKELIEEHQTQLATLDLGDDCHKPDVCIRGPVRVNSAHKFIAQTIRAQEREAAKHLENSNPCTDDDHD